MPLSSESRRYKAYSLSHTLSPSLVSNHHLSPTLSFEAQSDNGDGECVSHLSIISLFHSVSEMLNLLSSRLFFFFSRMNFCKNRVEEASMQLVAGGGGENNGVTQDANNCKPQNLSTLYDFASDVQTGVRMFIRSLKMDCFYFLDLWMNWIIWNRFESSYFESIGLTGLLRWNGFIFRTLFLYMIFDQVYFDVIFMLLSFECFRIRSRVILISEIDLKLALV